MFIKSVILFIFAIIKIINNDMRKNLKIQYYMKTKAFLLFTPPYLMNYLIIHLIVAIIKRYSTKSNKLIKLNFKT